MTTSAKGWTDATIGEVAELIRGVTYKKEQASNHPAEGVVPLLRATNIAAKLVLDGDLVYVPESVVAEKQMMRTGDIIVAASSGSQAVVGKSAHLTSAWKGTFGAFCAVLRAHAVDPRFLAYRISAPDIRKLWSDAASGTNINNLKRDHLLSTRIAVPQIDDQRRIVEVIEEQFSRLDAAEASLTRVEHLANALAEAAYRTVRSPQWPSVKLSAIARTSSGGTPSRRKVENFGGAIPWVKSGELGDSNVRATVERISDRGLASSSAKLLKRGTLMMAMYGATVGKLGILDMDSAATNQAVCAIEPHDAALVPFIWFCLRAMRSDLIHAAKGGAQPNISQGMIRDLMIPMPPPDERTRLISEIARQVGACERAAVVAVKGRLQIRHLRRAILERAFSGRLAPRSHGEDSVSSAPGVLHAVHVARGMKRNGAGPLMASEVSA
jgi:type I restriction enzyme S subunit